MSKIAFYSFVIQAAFCGMLLANDANAQKESIEEIKVQIEKNNTKLRSLFKEIGKQTGFEFSYDKLKVNDEKWVKISSGDKYLANVLREVAKESALNFKRINDNIFVSNSEVSFGEPVLEINPVQLNVTGTITSQEDGQPLPGVSILIKESSKGTTTDIYGKFALSVNQGDILQFSFIGYQTQEITVTTQSIINVTLAADLEQLEEVLVVGYGAVKKSDLTGSVSSVSSDELKALPLTSFDQGLQGRAAGVQVTQNSGQPGGATSIRIRGGNSINAGNEPLYVIDGFPVYNDNQGSQAGAVFAPSQNVLATLNPNDIESIEILKDASATAIYGSRGANGVVMITTKKGKAGQGNIDFEMYYGVQEVARIIPMLNARQYAEFRNEAFENRGGLPTYSADEVAALGEGTNWQEELFDTAPIQNYQLSFSGGNAKSRYALSLNYFNQEGIIINSGFERFSARLNLDSEVNSRVKVGANLTINSTFSDVARTGGGVSGTSSLQSPNGSVVASAIFYNPIIPVRDENGDFTFDNAVGTQGNGGGNQANVPFGNPIALATLSTNESANNRFLGSVFADIKIIEGLNFRTSIGADILSNKQNSYFPSTIRLGRNTDGEARIGSLFSYSWLNENILTFDKELNENHRFNVVAGLTLQKFQQENQFSQAAGFTNDILTFNNLGAGSQLLPSGSSFRDWSLLSYLSRINYTLNEKFLFTFTGRIDGSSRFGENNKYAFFPSAAFAWRLADEEFIQNLGIFDDLKLRTSVGVTGNQEIPVYRSLPRLGINRYTLNGSEQIGISPVSIPNSDLRWEKTTQYDIGFDMAFLDGRLNVTADYYYKRTNDLLLNVNLPRSSGFGSALQNIGEVENKGFELGINAVIVDKAFKWSSDFNLSLNRNEVLDLGQESIRFDNGGFGANNGFNLFKGQAITVLQEGEPVGNFVGFENAGIFNSQAEIDDSAQPGAQIGGRRYVDQNGDGTIDDEDRVILGNALPDFIGGFNNTFSYKNFELNAFFQFSVGNEVYNMIALEAEFLNGRQNNSTTVLNRWTPENTNTDVARAGNPSYHFFRQSTDRYVEDASFLRLRNISLTYNIPSEKVSWLRNAKVYVSAQNLWTLTDYTGYDPEVNITQESNTFLGFDYGTYPLAKTYTVGMNIGF